MSETAGERVSVGSAFDPENQQLAILITLGRLYDVQLLILRETNRAMYDQIVEQHSKGRLLGPAPAIFVESEES